MDERGTCGSGLVLRKGRKATPGLYNVRFRSLDLTVAMLELLARTTPARLVAAQLLVIAYWRRGYRYFGTLLAQLLASQARCSGVLELHATRQLFGLAAQASFFFGRVFAANLYVRQHTDGVALDRLQQLLEQAERLALVLLLRVLLRITTQVNTVTQVVHGRQVVFPQVVQYAQQNLLLEGSQGLETGLVFLLGVGRGDLAQQLLAQGLLDRKSVV